MTPSGDDGGVRDPLEARALTIVAGGKTLLRDASFSIADRELILLVGPSGAGKSLLLQILAGVLAPHKIADVTVSGSLRIGDVDLLAVRNPPPLPVGMVFQDHALFDDLSAVDNLRFAADHRTSSNAATSQLPANLLSEFGLTATRHVRTLSGGQRQRLAVARTLAQDPRIIIYDEPTTGLDLDNADRVARRIRETHDAHGKTSVVVTHDYATLLPIADRVLMLDPTLHAIRQVEPEEVEGAMRGAAEMLHRAPEEEVIDAKRWSLTPFLHRTVDLVVPFLRYFESIVPRWPRVRWGLHFLVGQLRLVTFTSAIVYMMVAGVILGVVSTYFTFRFLPHRRYTESLLTDEILAGLGYLIWRVLGPVLCTLLVAARCGAAVSADLGNRTYSRQLDAMRSMGIEPRRYLFTAVTWAFLIGTPLLTLVVFAMTRLTSEFVFVYNFPQHSPFFWNLHFHRFLVENHEWWYDGAAWMLAKVEASGAGIAMIAYYFGVRPKRSGRDISLGVTSTIIWATLWVLLVHFIFAFIEF